jgi:hypothetical protein
MDICPLKSNLIGISDIGILMDSLFEFRVFSEFGGAAVAWAF